MGAEGSIESVKQEQNGNRQIAIIHLMSRQRRIQRIFDVIDKQVHSPRIGGEIES